MDKIYLQLQKCLWAPLWNLDSYKYSTKIRDYAMHICVTPTPVWIIFLKANMPHNNRIIASYNFVFYSMNGMKCNDLYAAHTCFEYQSKGLISQRLVTKLFHLIIFSLVFIAKNIYTKKNIIGMQSTIKVVINNLWFD